MKKNLLIFAFAFLSFISFSAFIKADDPFTEFLKKLEAFTKSLPQEKIHLHLDKPFYAIGDDIWFKAYVIDSKTQAPTTISNILYVELIDEMDSLKKQLLLPMQTGISWGDFKLPDTLAEGNYRIRAYTNWMRNAGPDFFFDKTIKIGNSWANKVFIKADYTFSREEQNEKVNSIISFTDKKGNPYQNAEVSYSVALGSKVINKGQTTTNNKGEITINFINTQPNNNQSGTITSTLTLPDKQKIAKIIPLRTTSAAIDVQFFPESGSLIQNLPNKVAFKALNPQGKGQEVKGIILDNDGEEITSFQTSYLGMGSFSLQPMVGKTYRAKIDGKFFDLPKTESNGYVLTVNTNDSSKVVAKVFFSDNLVGKGELQLLAHQYGKVYFSVKIPSSKNFAVVNFPKSEFISGITTLTLFDAQTIPVAERLIFVNNNFDKIKIGVNNLKGSYEKKSPVILDLDATNDDLPTQGSFSVAVTNSSAVEPDFENESNILTSLLLKSELRGYIEKPNAYFMANDSKTQTGLDNLLLTQGWRKIDWKAIASSQLVNNRFLPETGLQVSGIVTTLSGKPIAKGKVSIFTFPVGMLTLDTLTDADGKFSFKDLEFSDSTKFVITALNEKGKPNVLLKLNSSPGQAITANKNTGDIEVNVNHQLKSYLNNSDVYFDEQTKKGMLSHTIQLKKVDIIGQKKKFEHSSNLNGSGKADISFTIKDFKNALRLSDILGTKNRNLASQFYKDPGKWPLVVLDGVYLSVGKIPSGTNLLDNINPMDVESMEILTSPNYTTLYGSRAINGVIVVTTRKGEYIPDEKEEQNVIHYNPKGYYIPREFYSPRYDTKPDSKPDSRTTIYWNPSISSNETGKFKLDYFNADSPGVYRVVIEGIDLLGNLARKTFTYQVN